MPNRGESANPAKAPQTEAKSVNISPPEQRPPGEIKSENPDNDESKTTVVVVQELHTLEKMNIFGQLGLLIVGVIGIVVYGRQLRTMNLQVGEMKNQEGQTQQQLDLSRHQLEVSQRPWVAIEAKASSPLVLHRNKKGTLSIDFTLHNSGQTPAIEASFLAFGRTRVNIDSALQEAHQMCLMVTPSEDKPTPLQRTIFPGRDFVDKRPLEFLPTEPYLLDGYVYLYVTGCEAYKSSLEPRRWRYSEFIAEVSQKDASGHMLPLPVEGTVPLRKLALDPFVYPQLAN